MHRGAAADIAVACAARRDGHAGLSGFAEDEGRFLGGLRKNHQLGSSLREPFVGGELRRGRCHHGVGAEFFDEFFAKGGAHGAFSKKCQASATPSAARFEAMWPFERRMVSRTSGMAFDGQQVLAA